MYRLGYGRLQELVLVIREVIIDCELLTVNCISIFLLRMILSRLENEFRVSSSRVNPTPQALPLVYVQVCEILRLKIYDLCRILYRLSANCTNQIHLLNKRVEFTAKTNDFVGKNHGKTIKIFLELIRIFY